MHFSPNIVAGCFSNLGRIQCWWKFRIETDFTCRTYSLIEYKHNIEIKLFQFELEAKIELFF
jgi:hypothetical protein